MAGGSSGSGAGDGRLDLDELGGIVDSPDGYRLGDASADSDLLGDDSRVSLGERLEAAGVLPWVRRHRVLLGGAAVVVVGVAVAGTAYASSRPPEIATTPGVQVFSVNIDNGYVDVAGLRTAQQSYQVVQDERTATARVDAIRGPGIRTSTAVDVPGSTAGGQSTLLAVLECDDRAIAAQQGDYQIHVSSTDVWGRPVDAWVQAPVSNLDWATSVSGNCWDQVARERVRLTSVGMSPDVEGRAIDLALDLRSDLPMAALMLVAAGDYDGVGLEDSLGVTVEPRTTARVSGRLVLRSCTPAPALPQVAIPIDGPNGYRSGPGLQLVVTGPNQGYGNSVALPFDEATATRLQSMLSRLCAGAPEVQLIGSGYATAVGLGGSGVQVPLNLRLRLPAGVTGTAVSTGLDAPAGTAGTPVSIRGGRVSVPWAFTCDFVPQPVTVTVRATDRQGGTWPQRVDVPLELLADAAIAACPGFTEQRLVEEGGWALEGVQPTYPSGG